jgi:predicted mannosyl-3-phosphoglycerate phosphatase (HAD superfamily)
MRRQSVAEAKIDISELKNEGSDVIKELTTLLEEKTKAKAEIGASEITLRIEDEKEAISRTHLRVLLRKFLHRNKLKDYYRVIAGKDKAFVVKEKRVSEEEEE